MTGKNLQYHIKVLKDELNLRRKKNPSYSLRAFAKYLEISPSLLSNLLRGLKGISDKKAGNIAKKLQLDAENKKFFVLSAVGAHGRSATKRKGAAAELENLKKRQDNTVKFAGNEIEVIRSWHYLTFLELLELKDCDHSITWFARRLGLSTMATDKIVSQLISLKMVEIIDQKYTARHAESQSSFDVPSPAIKDFHRSVLTEAAKALVRDDVMKREYMSMTFAFNEKKVAEAKEALREFQTQFASRFYEQDAEKDSVYQLSLQFFRTDLPVGDHK
ncbi:hypothetical protein AZI86_10025 [Bdellovibrio bacteriovorus]|uniref:HTH cro/C1-type domain-containing protein n=1 Tax=Bdellovibrio bacteriovorus TaxID=959 RepID=A0A150WSZ9_BDEBC|nr:TIGR02147 family protein [Bdellovibrio bacteriovorus]KYG67325.1 hypothetical protein AZI86_10025 [Bdellovibrio bacteriovorus]